MILEPDNRVALFVIPSDVETSLNISVDL
jgi:hypothetical protein